MESESPKKEGTTPTEESIISRAVTPPIPAEELLLIDLQPQRSRDTSSKWPPTPADTEEELAEARFATLSCSYDLGFPKQTQNTNGHKHSEPGIQKDMSLCKLARWPRWWSQPNQPFVHGCVQGETGIW